MKFLHLSFQICLLLACHSIWATEPISAVKSCKVAAESPAAKPQSLAPEIAKKSQELFHILILLQANPQNLSLLSAKMKSMILELSGGRKDFDNSELLELIFKKIVNFNIETDPRLKELRLATKGYMTSFEKLRDLFPEQETAVMNMRKRFRIPQDGERYFWQEFYKEQRIKIESNITAMAESAGVKSRQLTDSTYNKEYSGPEKGSIDGHSSWGFDLLPPNDPIFSSPEYLSMYLNQHGPSGTGYVRRDINQMVTAFSNMLQSWIPKTNEVRDVNVKRFTVTGSDANNLFFEIAQNSYRNKIQYDEDKNSGMPETKAQLIFMSGIYGGTVGDIKKIAHGPMNHPLAVENPMSFEQHISDPKELERVMDLEEKALEKIRALATNKKLAIGGLLMEPILGSGNYKPVMFYRTEFLLKLRELCDELEIPIFADEIMTGGGRTGEFFAFQHYPGFYPDFVSFGKGLQAAGVIQIDRRNKLNLYQLLSDSGTTIKANTEALLKGYFVMKAIRDRNLIENARVVGEYLLEKTKKKYGSFASPDNVRGIGFYLYAKDSRFKGNFSGRILAPMTLTKKDVDAVFKN